MKKECPNCHKTYVNNENFCLSCGTTLVSVTENRKDSKPTSTESTRPSTQNRNNNKGKGCLKNILIFIVLLVIALFALYHYVSNAATYLRVEPDELQVLKCGGSTTVDVDYDGYFWVINHKPDWVEVEEDDANKKIAVTLTPNSEGLNREGSITLQSGKQLAQLIIKQNGKATVLRLSESNIKFDKSGGIETISVETDGINTKFESPEWVSVSKTEEGNLLVRCPSNDDEYRTGTIKVSEDNVSASIYVTQAGTCNNCHGSGSFSCSACNGMGRTYFGMYSSYCMWCGGNGSKQCGSCGGDGMRE